MKRNHADEPDYYAAVERHFVSLRGSPLFITPGEWHLIHRWKEQRIPLRVVIQALDQAFQRKRSARPIKRLSYCRQTVEASFRRFREAMAGASDPGVSSDSDRSSQVTSYLRELLESLRSRRAAIEAEHPSLAPLARTLGDCAEALESTFRGELTAETLTGIETELAHWDEILCAGAEQSLDAEERRRLLQAAERALGDYRTRMPAEVYRSAVESAFRKELRRRFALPALSLFYL